MTILTMVDSTHPIVSPPSGATVHAGYLDGHGETRHWTAEDWRAAARVYAGIIPIYVAFSSFATPEADADSAIAQWTGFGFETAGVAFVLDIEAKVAQKAHDARYPGQWCARIRSHGAVPIDYSSKSTMPLVNEDESEEWVAYYNGIDSLDGHAGHQFSNPGPWDLSVIDPVRMPPFWPGGRPANIGAALATVPARRDAARRFVALMADPRGRGYWQVKGAGGVFTHTPNDLPFFGSMGSSILNQPICAGASMPGGSGYILAAEDGGVFTFGGAQFAGSLAAKSLAAPIVSVAVTPSGLGYWLLGEDGGVFAFGDAKFRGRTKLTVPCVEIIADPKGRGYWVVSADGGVFTFGTRGLLFHGSMGGEQLNAPVVAAAAMPDGEGYVLAASDGGVFSFGSAQSFGSRQPDMVSTVSAIALTATGQGYWLQRSDTGHLATFGDAVVQGRRTPT